MTFTTGNHRATPSSPSSLPGGYDARALETGSGVADPRRKPIRAGIQVALWNEVDSGRADKYILAGVLEHMHQGELVLLAASALARLERIELDHAA